MTALSKLWTNEPVAVIAGIVFVVTTIATQLLDNGVVSSDGGKNALHAIVGIAIALGAYLARRNVTPAQ